MESKCNENIQKKISDNIDYNLREKQRCKKFGQDVLETIPKCDMLFKEFVYHLCGDDKYERSYLLNMQKNILNDIKDVTLEDKSINNSYGLNDGFEDNIVDKVLEKHNISKSVFTNACFNVEYINPIIENLDKQTRDNINRKSDSSYRDVKINSVSDAKKFELLFNLKNPGVGVKLECSLQNIDMDYYRHGGHNFMNYYWLNCTINKYN